MRIRSRRSAAGLLGAIALWLGAIGLVQARAVRAPGLPVAVPATLTIQAKPNVAPPAPQQTATPGATYVGDDTCLTCHDGQKKGYVGSAHHRAIDPRTPAAGKGCETCHGAGSKHAEDPVNVRLINFKTASREQIEATCATCHNRGEHALWEGSQHEARGLTCTTCHSVHNSKSPTAQLKERNQLEQCATCHREKVSKVDRTGHMPLREGKMQCTSCHNVHGATNVKLLRKGDSSAELCMSCHADKRGPYLWEHAPSRDGCVTCHDPHGSSNERMLVAKPPILCQRCHVASRHPSTIYDAATVGSGANPSVRIYGRSCVTCHSAIHGSNHPSGQRFIR